MKDARHNQWRKIRADVMDVVTEKTRGRCFYCGIDISDRTTIDHFLPTSAGGSDHPSNLVPACESCNRAKGPRPLSNWRRILRWRSAAERGIPKFSKEQMAWLGAKGIDPLADVPIPKFWFEQKGLPEPIDEEWEALR